MLTDCNAQQTRSLPRNTNSRIETSGITLIGQTLANDNYFEGDIQQIYIIPSPDAAYEQCYEYLPECTQPFPYEEVDNNQDNANSNEDDEEEDKDQRIDGSTDGSIDANIDANIDENIDNCKNTSIEYKLF